tara:strand:- start:241 stop:651 length:411 start_codon:yes stop_codon:yes gene_type:complete
MANLKMSRDFNDFTNHELKVAEAAIKNQRESRDAEFMSQFHEGTPIAVTTSIMSKDDDNQIYPAYITKVNKKSIKIGYAVNDDYTEKSFVTRQKTWKIETLANYVQAGFIHKSFTSHWMGRDARYENYPAYGVTYK